MGTAKKKARRVPTNGKPRSCKCGSDACAEDVSKGAVLFRLRGKHHHTADWAKANMPEENEREGVDVLRKGGTYVNVMRHIPDGYWNKKGDKPMLKWMTADSIVPHAVTGKQRKYHHLVKAHVKAKNALEKVMKARGSRPTKRDSSKVLRSRLCPCNACAYDIAQTPSRRMPAA